jgi:hypothetical protein
MWSTLRPGPGVASPPGATVVSQGCPKGRSRRGELNAVTANPQTPQLPNLRKRIAGCLVPVSALAEASVAISLPQAFCAYWDKTDQRTKPAVSSGLVRSG